MLADQPPPVPDLAGSGLATRVRAALAGAGDPERAVAQQAYMKSEMAFRGITSAELSALIRPVLAGYRPVDRAAWDADVRALWDSAAYREERYAALAVARHRAARGWQDPEALDLYRHLVATGAWWDTVDVVAAHLVGGVLGAHRAVVTPVVRAWARADDLWLRRTAVLAQLRHRAETDPALLHDVIADNVDDRSFWLRKAIGWALRSYAATDPEWVRAEVAGWGPQLSGLSRREALKHLG